MHFNNKRINRGDSQSEIKDKVNYNFNQVLSFGIGHEGLIGPKGATGIPGPSGKIGETGSTGNRASDWFRGNTVPATGDSQEFDLWVDDSSSLGDIYERGSSSWSYTGLSLFNSDYFEVYSGIVGPLGLTDKSAIGFKSSYAPDQTSLVVSDTYFSSSDVNPNNSKLLVSTEDQITNPIFSFVKSNSNSTNSPSFYWKNTGAFSDLLFKSPGKLSIISLLDLELSSYQPSGGDDIRLYGSSFYANTSGNVNILSNAELSFITSYFQTTPFILESLNIGINTSKFYTKTLTQIFNLFDSPGNYILKSVPASGSTFNYFGGISINSDSSTSRIFDFTGMDGHSVLYGLPSGSVSSGNHKQIVFGASGGGSTGSTGAPYSYHVKRLNNISVASVGFRCVPYEERNFSIPASPGVSNILNISVPSLWNSNMLVCTYINNSSVIDQYIFIPSSLNSSLEPVFYNGEGNEYRVYLNYENPSSSAGKIKGIIYIYSYRRGDGVISSRRVSFGFTTPCSYVDLFWAYKGSNTNPNGRIFWKTCSGEGGFLEVTNAYSVSGNSAPNFPTR